MNTKKFVFILLCWRKPGAASLTLWHVRVRLSSLDPLSWIDQQSLMASKLLCKRQKNFRFRFIGGQFSHFGKSNFCLFNFFIIKSVVLKRSAGKTRPNNYTIIFISMLIFFLNRVQHIYMCIISAGQLDMLNIWLLILEPSFTNSIILQWWIIIACSQNVLTPYHAIIQKGK